MENGNMIRKNSKNLIEWVYENIVDFTDENDTSTLTWNSTQEDARRFLQSIPQKERVQKYGFFSCRSHFFLVESFDDVRQVLEKGFISEMTCEKIYRWDSEVERENWNMTDVRGVLYPDTTLDDATEEKFLSNIMLRLLNAGLLEYVNIEEEHKKMFILTEKGEDVFGDIL